MFSIFKNTEEKTEEPNWITNMARLKIGTMPETMWRYLCAAEGRALTVEEQESYLKISYMLDDEHTL